MSCVSYARRVPVLVERYPDGLRVTFDCGHSVYTTSTIERATYRCLLCLRGVARPRREAA